MIAKNEQGGIADAVAAVLPFVDEVLVVDTGSDDNTAQVAREAGARVEHFPWPGSFAAARNAAADMASYDLVLVVDADDHVKGVPVQFKKAVGRADEQVIFTCWVASGSSANGTSVVRSAISRRVYDRRYWQYEGRVHENLARIDGQDGTVSELPEPTLSIDHVGYDIDAESMRLKGARNLALLKDALDQDDMSQEARARMLWELSRAAKAMGRTEAAIHPLRQSYAIATGPLRAVVAGDLALALCALDRAPEAARYVGDIQSSSASPQWVAWVTARVLAGVGRKADAAKLLQVAVSGPLVSPIGLRRSPAPAWQDLAALLESTGDAQGAKEALRRAQEA